MAIDWDNEYPIIIGVAVQHGVDPRFIRAIRQQENGPPGREFGVLTVSAPTYPQQLEVACYSVAHRLAEYVSWSGATGVALYAAGRVQYSESFIQWFGDHWAPRQAPNDPKDTNANWVPNVTKIYQDLCR